MESISNQGLRGLLLNFRLLFSLHSRIPANEALPSSTFSLALAFAHSCRARHRMKERRRNARVGLLGHGHREFRTFGDAVGPALHDALVARVKAHGFLAVCVMIAEQRSLPAPERMPRHRHRTRHVDAHHAHVNLPREYARCAAVGCEKRYAVPQFVRVDECYRTREIRQADNRQDRPENLFSIDAHIGLHVVKERAAEKEALFVAGNGMAATIDDELGTCRDARIDIARHLGAMSGGDERPHVQTGLHRRRRS